MYGPSRGRGRYPDELVWGPRRIQISIWLGVVCAVLAAAFAYQALGQLYLCIMLLILAFLNFPIPALPDGHDLA